MTGENITNIQPGPAQRVVQLPKGREDTWASLSSCFHFIMVSSHFCCGSPIQQREKRQKMAGIHTPFEACSFYCVSKQWSPANLWISSGSLHAFTILLPQPQLPSLLFTALWSVRLFLCMPCKKVSWKEKKMSLSQVPTFSSLTWILSICYLWNFMWFVAWANSCLLLTAQSTQPKINKKLVLWQNTSSTAKICVS